MPKTPQANNSESELRYQWLVTARDGAGVLKGTHVVEKFAFKGSPGYDSRTLHIPNGQWAKFTPFEKQYWEHKSKLFDTILFFKKGNFYELYENDADIASKEFNLRVVERVNMRMAGIPEVSFEHWASKFIGLGYKVAKVEQAPTSINASTVRGSPAGKVIHPPTHP